MISPTHMKMWHFFMYENIQKSWYFQTISLNVSTWYIHTYLRGLLFVLVIYTLCGASALQSVEIQRSLGDADVWDSTLESAILFVSSLGRFLDMLGVVWVKLVTPYLKYIRRYFRCNTGCFNVAVYFLTRVLTLACQCTNKTHTHHMKMAY